MSTGGTDGIPEGIGGSRDTVRSAGTYATSPGFEAAAASRPSKHMTGLGPAPSKRGEKNGVSRTTAAGIDQSGVT